MYESIFYDRDTSSVVYCSEQPARVSERKRYDVSSHHVQALNAMVAQRQNLKQSRLHDSSTDRKTASILVEMRTRFPGRG
jgi:hypothetical protein